MDNECAMQIVEQLSQLNQSIVALKESLPTSEQCAALGELPDKLHEGFRIVHKGITGYEYNALI